jgi:hypothetical protein
MATQSIKSGSNQVPLPNSNPSESTIAPAPRPVSISSSPKPASNNSLLSNLPLRESGSAQATPREAPVPQVQLPRPHTLASKNYSSSKPESSTDLEPRTSPQVYSGQPSQAPLPYGPAQAGGGQAQVAGGQAQAGGGPAQAGGGPAQVGGGLPQPILAVETEGMDTREKNQIAQQNVKNNPAAPNLPDLQEAARQASLNYTQGPTTWGDARAAAHQAVQGGVTSGSVYGLGRNLFRNVAEAAVKQAGIQNAQAQSLAISATQLTSNVAAGAGKSLDTHVTGPASAGNARFVTTPNEPSAIFPDASRTLANELNPGYGSDLRTQIKTGQDDLKKSTTYNATGQWAFGTGAATNAIASKVADVLIPDPAANLGVKVAVGVAAPAAAGAVVGAVKGYAQGTAKMDVPTYESMTALNEAIHDPIDGIGLNGIYGLGYRREPTAEEINALETEKHNLFYSRKRSDADIAFDKGEAAKQVAQSPRGIAEGLKANIESYRDNLKSTNIISAAGALVATGVDMVAPDPAGIAGTAVRAVSNGAGIAYAIPGLYENQPKLAGTQKRLRAEEDIRRDERALRNGVIHPGDDMV